MPMNIVFLIFLQRETPETNHTMFAKRHNIALSFTLGAIGYDVALMTVWASMQMLAFSTVLSPRVHLKHIFSLFNMTFTTLYNDGCLLL